MIGLNKFYNFVIFPVMNACNLKCTYCYQNVFNIKKNFMDSSILKKMIDKINLLECNNISITFHGGEPLLIGTDFYEEIFDYIEKNNSKKCFTFIFQTNGTLISSKYLKILKKNECNVGISLDGADFNANRLRFRNQKQFLGVVKNILLLKKNNIFFSIFITLGKHNINDLEKIYSFIEKINPNGFVINPMKSSDAVISSDEWFDILKKNSEFTKKTNIPELQTINLDFVKKGKIPYLCTINGTYNNFINMDYEGNIYKSCVFKYKNLYIGNINDEDVINKILYNTKFNPNISESIYYKSGKNEKYKYLLGDGCHLFRGENNRQEYVSGILKYLKESI